MKFLPAIAVLGIATSVAHADAPPAPAKPAVQAGRSAAKQTPLYCPVSGDKIASPKNAYASEVYKGKTYYFCCPACKPQFDKNPEKFVKHPAARKN